MADMTHTQRRSGNDSRSRTRREPGVRLALTGLAGAATMLAAGCVVSVGGGSRHSTPSSWDSSATNYRVTQLEFAEVLDTTRHLEVGMARDDALSQYDPRLLSKFSTLRLDHGSGDHIIEEWRVRATSPGVYHERWMYFVDGELDSFHDTRLEDDEVRYLGLIWSDDDSHESED
jgi:hypothetical protein